MNILLKGMRRVSQVMRRAGGLGASPEAPQQSAPAAVPVAGAGFLTFQCNVCGSSCRVRLAELNREAASCTHCSSSMRMRSIVHLLSLELFGQSFPLPEFPVRKDITGFGLSDWEGYAVPLSERLKYTNTFYHTDPMLDIMNIDGSLEGTLDFLICSDVLEHVPPPVSIAFDNMYRLLKPSGVVIFTVPYAKYGKTVEHFPDLHHFEIEKHGERYILRNMTTDGREQVFDNLIFHGGPGTTVEMRLFSETSLLEEFERAGFHYVTFRGEPCFDYGIYWNIPCVPVTARKQVSFVSELQMLDVPEPADLMTYSFDRVAERTRAVEICGWTFVRGENTDDSVTSVVLDSGTRKYVFSTQPVLRPDVTKYFNSQNLDNSGFNAFIMKKELGEGEYRVGLLNAKGRRQVFQPTHVIVRV